MNKKRFNKKLVLIFLIQCLLTFIIVSIRNPWRDEAQSFLLAKNLNIIDLFKQLSYEGHPSLWYLVLKVCISFKISYVNTKYIAWVISTIATFLLFFYTKMEDKYKILIAFMPATFYVSVYARSYCLIYLFIVFLIILYKDRLKYPLLYGLVLLLLLNTHILVIGFVGSLCLIDLIELFKTKNKKILIPLILAILGVLIGYLPFIHSIMYEVNDISVNVGFDRILSNVIFLYACIYTFDYVFGLLLLLFYLHLLVKNKYYNNLVIFLINFLFQSLVFIYITPVNIHLSTVMSFTLVFDFYLFCKNNNIEEKIFGKNTINEKNIVLLLLIFMLPTTIYYYYTDIKENNVNTVNTVDYINNNLDIDKVYLAGNIQLATSLVPALNNNLKDIYENKKVSFYDLSYNKINIECKTNNTYYIPIDSYVVICVSDKLDFLKSNEFKNYDYELIYEADKQRTIKIVENESYFIIHIKGYKLSF